jgi:hypothetical protein
MSVVIITDDKDRLLVDREEARDLELKLNVTSKGHLWKHIGDVLFDFMSERVPVSTRLVVTTEQLAFLLVLKNRKGWETCKDL